MTAQEIGDLVIGNFKAAVGSDKETQRLLKLLQNGKATQADARRYAERLGELLSKSWGEAVSFADVRTITKEIADATILPMLREVHAETMAYAGELQAIAYEEAGLGINPVTVGFEESQIAARARGIAGKVVDQTAEEAAMLLETPVINLAEHMVDSWVRHNADAAYNAGFKPTIKRTPEPYGKVGYPRAGFYKGRKAKVMREIPCPWCRGLAGTYDFEDVKSAGWSDVWRRHDDCRCTIEYKIGKRVSEVQNYRKASPATIESRKSHGLIEGQDGHSNS